jgi:hypothetical protein
MSEVGRFRTPHHGNRTARLAGGFLTLVYPFAAFSTPSNWRSRLEQNAFGGDNVHSSERDRVRRPRDGGLPLTCHRLRDAGRPGKPANLDE